MSVSYSAYQPSGQLGSKLEHVIITFQKNEIPLFGRAVEVVGWQSIFIVILCTLKQLLLFDVIQEQQRNINCELYQAISEIADTEFSAEKLTDVIFGFYKMTEEMLILKLIDVNEVELLVRKLPREIVEEHFQDDTDTIEKMLALFPVKKEVDIKVLSAAFHAIYFATLHKAEIGEQYDEALYSLIYGIVTQII